jgi:putative ABC transport system permease protein
VNGAFSLRIGLDALRANPLRTILSTLGVIMGVAAMVAVLAIGDGVEIYGRAQVSRLTDVQAVLIMPQLFERLDGIFVERSDVVAFGLSDLAALRAATPEAHRAVLTTGAGTIAQLEGSTARGRGLRVTAGTPDIFTLRHVTAAAGALFTDADVAAARPIVILSAGAADTLAGSPGTGATLLGKKLAVQDRSFTITGVLAAREDGERMEAFVPFGTIEGQGFGRRGATATIALIANSVEAVDSMQRHAERWLEGRYGDKWRQRVNVVAETQRLKQIAQVFLVFKILMVAITGVSLLVGGIGIMNVLLASVTERTREIGIRKAAGARHVDILRQFLAESVSITGAGATVGTLLGLGIAFLAAAIMRWRTQAPVHAAVTAGTILFAATASITVGLAFGLYPALRAARLSPIDAIRHE